MRLRGKFLIFMILAGAVPLVILGGYTLTTMQVSVRRAADESLLALTTQLAKDVRRTVADTYDSILLLSENPIIISKDSTRSELEAELTRTQRFHPILNDLTLVDPAGRVQAGVHYSFRGTYAATSWFRRAAKGQDILSDVHALIHPYQTVMTAAVPVHGENGEITGVLIGQLSLKPVWKILRSVSLGPDSAALIMDRRGYVVGGPAGMPLLEEPPVPGLTRIVSESDQGVATIDWGQSDYLAAHLPVDLVEPRAAATGWRLVLLRPRSKAYAALYDLRRTLSLAALTSLAAIVLLSASLSRSIHHRVKELVEGARRLGQGDFDSPLPVRGQDEISELARSFNKASDDLATSRQELKRHHEQLEGKVQERTSQLSRANSVLTQEIEERKRAQGELARLNRNLESLVDERTADLKAKAAQLEEANRRLLELDEMKSAFLSSVSHELRTPLTSVLGFAHMIERDFSRTFAPLAGDKEQQDRAERITQNLRIIAREGKRLTQLINEVLDLSKIESGRLEWHDTDVNPAVIIHQAVEAMQGEFARRREVALVNRAPSRLPEITIDPDRLHQVLINLLSNAAKFTDKGEVGIDAAAENGVLRIEVRDTGTGIPEQDLPRIFDKFHQVRHADTLSDKPKGTGLGLSICRRIVQHYQGEIHARSTFGQGSVFTVSLPLSRNG